MKAPPPTSKLAMIICSCNLLTDHDVRTARTANGEAPRSPCQVYGCLRCNPQCGRCARTIRRIMDEALGANPPDSRAGRPEV